MAIGTNPIGWALRKNEGKTKSRTQTKQTIYYCMLYTYTTSTKKNEKMKKKNKQKARKYYMVLCSFYILLSFAEAIHRSSWTDWNRHCCPNDFDDVLPLTWQHIRLNIQNQCSNLSPMCYKEWQSKFCQYIFSDFVYVRPFYFSYFFFYPPL